MDDDIDTQNSPTTEVVSDSSSWRDSLEDEIKDDPSLKKFTEIGTLAKGYINLQKLVGLEKIPKPSSAFNPKDESRETWDHVFGQLGRPDTPEGYDFGKFQLPEGMDLDETFETKLKKVGHDLGFNNEQLKGLNDFYLTDQAEKFTTNSADINNRREDSESKLKANWGSAFDEKVSLARKAVEQLCSPEMKNHLVETGLGDNVDFVQFFSKLGEQIVGETRLIGTGGEDRPMTSQDLNERIDELQSHKGRFDEKHSEHKVIKNKLTKLFAEKARIKDLTI